MLYILALLMFERYLQVLCLHPHCSEFVLFQDLEHYKKYERCKERI